MNELQITQKTEGWADRLEDMLKEKAGKPFQWGTNDCCVLTCDAVYAMTGRDPGAWGRDTYTTSFGAFKQLKKYGNVGFLNTFSAIFEEMGFDEVDDVKFGDIAFVRIQNADPEDNHIMFGGVTMSIGYNDIGSVVGVSDEGLVLIEEYELVKAWRL